MTDIIIIGAGIAGLACAEPALKATAVVAAAPAPAAAMKFLLLVSLMRYCLPVDLCPAPCEPCHRRFDTTVQADWRARRSNRRSLRYLARSGEGRAG